MTATLWETGARGPEEGVLNVTFKCYFVLLNVTFGVMSDI